MEDSFDVLKLQNQLCFPLYAAAKSVVAMYKPFLDKLDLTYTQYIAMMVIWECETITVKELGEKLYLDSGTLTPLLKRLEAKGYVKRERDALDERVVNIAITDEGVRLKGKAVIIPREMVSCIPLSSDEAKTLYMLLYKMLGKF